MIKHLFFAVLATQLLTGCSNYSFSRAFYEGVQTKNQLESSPPERLNNPQINYDQYEAERKR